MKLKFIKKQLKAFSLVEALVSISIILIAVLGPLTLILNSVNSIMQNKNRVIASYLGEEIIEEFRAFRDGIVIACSDLQINYDMYGDISSAYCNKDGANLPINRSYLLNNNGDIEYTNRNIAWKLFIERLQSVLNKEDLYLDKNSFRYDVLSSITDDYASCYLELNTNIGYLCGGPSSNLFNRSVKLTQNTNNSLKVEVTVRYVMSSLFGVGDKYIKIIDYIYER